MLTAHETAHLPQGDAVLHAAASTPATTLEVAPAITVTHLYASASGEVAFGTPVTFVAAVVTNDSPTPPTGQVEFVGEHITPLQAFTLDSKGLATVDLTLAPGIHTIRAVYRGEPGFEKSVSEPITLVVVDPHPARTVTDRVIDLVSENLGVPRDQITLQSSFEQDLGADSLDRVELLMAFEDEFHITVPDEHAEQIETVGQAVHLIEARLALLG
jgi:acyl carrier protein